MTFSRRSGLSAFLASVAALCVLVGGCGRTGLDRGAPPSPPGTDPPRPPEAGPPPDPCDDDDRDDDGFAALDCGGMDCADDDPSRFPGADEGCGTVDRDCDGMVVGCPPPTTVALGPADGCVVRSGAVACWGIHNFPPGVGSISPLWSPPTEIPGVVAAESVDLRADYTCALREGGRLGCWGVSPYEPMGRLPLFRTFDELGSFVAVAGRCLLEADGSVRCVQAGSGGVTLAAAEFPRARLLDASIGGAVCAVAWDDGTLHCGPSVGLLGLPVDIRRIPGAREVVDLAMGPGGGCIVAADGTVGCFSNSRLMVTSVEPVPGIDDAVEVAAGLGFSCARTRSGEVWCWGRNDGFQLGSSTDGMRSDTPVRVPGLPRPVIEVACGYQHACARLEDEQVWCWGQNIAGQLGDGVGGPAGGPRPVILD